MRKMKVGNQVLKVYGWAITAKGWEYYFLDNNKSDIRFAYVCGFENEMGDVSLTEIAPYIRSITFRDSDLNDIAPAPDCEWVE
jgi:hypothetical protein